MPQTNTNIDRERENRRDMCLCNDGDRTLWLVDGHPVAVITGDVIQLHEDLIAAGLTWHDDLYREELRSSSMHSANTNQAHARRRYLEGRADAIQLIEHKLRAMQTQANVEVSAAIRAESDATMRERAL